MKLIIFSLSHSKNYYNNTLINRNYYYSKYTHRYNYRKYISYVFLKLLFYNILWLILLFTICFIYVQKPDFSLKNTSSKKCYNKLFVFYLHCFNIF